MLKKYLEEELKCESEALEIIKVKLAALPETVLAPTKGGFYYYVKDKDGKPGKRRYIHRSDSCGPVSGRPVRGVAGWHRNGRLPGPKQRMKPQSAACCRRTLQPAAPRIPTVSKRGTRRAGRQWSAARSSRSGQRRGGRSGIRLLAAAYLGSGHNYRRPAAPLS